MSNTNNTQQQNVSEGKTEAFPQPRTMPANWDLSALDPADRVRGSFSRASTQGQGASTPIKNGQTRPQAGKSSETFPQPRTFPANWELLD